MIVYYSFGGATRIYAELLSELLNDTLFELREKNPRKGLLGMARGGFEALVKAQVALEEIPELPEGKPVFICSPVWAGRLTPAVLTFIKSTEFKRNKVNVILTCSNITGRDAYKKAVKEQLLLQKCPPGFVEVFVCNRKARADKAVIRKHLKKLVLNVDESF